MKSNAASINLPDFSVKCRAVDTFCRLSIQCELRLTALLVCVEKGVSSRHRTMAEHGGAFIDADEAMFRSKLAKDVNRHLFIPLFLEES